MHKLIIIIYTLLLASHFQFNFNYNNRTDGNDVMTQNLSIYCVTYNVAGETPKCDLKQLLGINVAPESAKRNQLIDVYAIGFEELPLRPLQSLIWFDPWALTVQSTLKDYDYVEVKSIKMMGIILMIYTKREILFKFRSVRTQYTRTGFGGILGNKGAVSIRADIDGVSMCFVNAHLAAHDNQIEQRIYEYNTIIESQRFDHPQTDSILSHDYVFFMGDLNFRIDGLTGHDIHQKIMQVSDSVHDDRFAELLTYDQLSNVRRDGRAFSELIESMPSFAPTYKFFFNSDNYDYINRKPAFTDRILYNCITNAYDNVTIDIRQMYYHSHPSYKQSDHKPVSSLFHCRTLSNATLSQLNIEPVIVTFHSIVNWRVMSDSIAWYSVKPYDNTKYVSNWDWIGLYKHNFTSIDDHITYVWASPSPSRWTPPNDEHESASQSSSLLSSEDETRPDSSSDLNPWFSVSFSESSLLIADRYRLVYVSQDRDVLGMSEPFGVLS